MNTLALRTILLISGMLIAFHDARAAEPVNVCRNLDVIDEALFFAADFAPPGADAAETVPTGDTASASPATAGSTQAVDSAEKPRLFALAADAGLSESGGAITMSVSPFLWMTALDGQVRSEQWKYQQYEAWRRFGGKVSFGGKGDAFDRDGDGVVDPALDAESESDIVTYELSWRFLGTTDRRDERNVDLFIDMAKRAFPDDQIAGLPLDDAAAKLLGRLAEERGKILANGPGGRILQPDDSVEDCTRLRRALAESPDYRDLVAKLAAARAIHEKKLESLRTEWIRRVDRQLVMSLVASGTEREFEYGGDKQSFGLRASRGFALPGSSFGLQLDYLKNELPSGLDELEGFKLGLEYKQLLPGLAESLGWQDPTFSFGIAAERYSDVPADAHDTIAVASAKLSIGAGDNIRIPISLKWANRTDLLADEDDVIAHIGISYDFDAFTGGKKK